MSSEEVWVAFLSLDPTFGGVIGELEFKHLSLGVVVRSVGLVEGVLCSHQGWIVDLDAV